MKEILSELIDEYIEGHRETMDLLSRPDWVDIINRGKEEVETGANALVSAAAPFDVSAASS